MCISFTDSLAQHLRSQNFAHSRCSFVSSKISPLCELLVAHITLIWLLPSVGTPVCHKITTIGESFVAYFTFERFFPCMRSEMSLQSFPTRKISFAQVTRIWFLSLVRSPMSCKVTAVQECLTAHVTFIGILISV